MLTLKIQEKEDEMPRYKRSPEADIMKKIKEAFVTVTIREEKKG
jgi:hypothetical protein